MIKLNEYKVALIKESSAEYDLKYNKIKKPQDAVDIFKEVYHLHTQAEEVLRMLTLSVKKTFTGSFEVSRGSLHSSVVTPREVFKRAFLKNASAILLAHNHPSGDSSPSGNDREITERLVEAGELLGVKVVDHIILGDNEFFSFLEEGLI